MSLLLSIFYHIYQISEVYGATVTKCDGQWREWWFISSVNVMKSQSRYNVYLFCDIETLTCKPSVFTFHRTLATACGGHRTTLVPLMNFRLRTTGNHISELLIPYIWRYCFFLFVKSDMSLTENRSGVIKAIVLTAVGILLGQTSFLPYWLKDKQNCSSCNWYLKYNEIPKGTEIFWSRMVFIYMRCPQTYIHVYIYFTQFITFSWYINFCNASPWFTMH